METWNPEGRGRCGARGLAIPVGDCDATRPCCDLPAGHPGWHREGVTEWSEGDHPEAAAEWAQQRQNEQWRVAVVNRDDTILALIQERDVLQVRADTQAEWLRELSAAVGYDPAADKWLYPEALRAVNTAARRARVWSALYRAAVESRDELGRLLDEADQ